MNYLVFTIVAVAIAFSETVVSHDNANQAVILSLVANPFSQKRSSAPPDIFGNWSVDISTPDGPCELRATVASGPDDLIQIDVQLFGNGKVEIKNSRQSLVAALYLVNGETIALIEPVLNLEQINFTTSFSNPTFFLCQLRQIENDKVGVVLPRIPWRSGEPAVGTMLQSISRSRKLLTGDSSNVLKLLQDSVSKEWFTEPAFSLERK